MEPIAEIRNVTKVFHKDGRSRTVLDGVSLQVRRGECVGLIGPSGAGKSTLARVMARFSDVTAGRILFRGQDITRCRGKALRDVYRHMQMIFQSPAASFDPRRTLGSSMEEGLKNFGFSAGERRDIVSRILAQCGLSEDIVSKYPHEVSGGQCQRAAAARAIAVGPDLLLCDEVTSSLDVTTQKQMMDLLLSLKKRRRMSFIFICHHAALAQQFCDRIAVMDGGKIVEEGPADDVIFHPRHSCTRKLIEASL